ncbi:MAG: helical backbone metal receptor [Ruminococcus sp.]|nr:helical backbone metal receptor [Ruminococcus sp.]MCM1478828.1 helical backbone metal receptor [Muribaculaceae bacterium]
MYKFVKKMLLCTVLAAALLCGCSKVEEELPEPVTETSVTEEKRYPVTAGSLIFNEQPETVGCLSPALTEIICQLGYGEKIIGRSVYCDYPAEIADRTELGSAANPDVDAIVAAKPQLLISQSPIAKKDITRIENAGTRVWIIPAPNSAEELYACYRDVAAVFGGKPNCEEAAAEAMKPLVNALAEAQGSVESFVYVMSSDLAAATDGTFAGSFFSCFGRNAAGEREDISLTEEELLELDPQWIILPYSVSEDVLPSGLSAVQSGRIITLGEEMPERIERPTARLDGVVYGVLEQIEEKSANGAAEDENGGDSE